MVFEIIIYEYIVKEIKCLIIVIIRYASINFDKFKLK
jgi:hypothetical protein